MFHNRISEVTGFFDANANAGAWAANPWFLGAKPLALGTSDLLSAAWAMAQRDHEIDKLFNASYYES